VSHKIQFAGGELRYATHDSGKEYLDEIVVARPKFVHVEVMSDTEIWMGIDLDDGSRIYCMFWSENGRAKIKYRAEVEPPTKSQSEEEA
jgi:hypothetical protein